MQQNKTLTSLIGRYSTKSLDFLVSRKAIRKRIASYIEGKVKEATEKPSKFPQRVQEDKYFMAKAIIGAMDKVLDNAKNAPHVRKGIANFLVNVGFNLNNDQVKNFQKEYGRRPPSFLVISPGKFCNLKCTGCYANSSSANSEKLDWDIFDKILTEKTELWGSHFTVISGGEPLLYKSRGKTLLDIVKKHQDNYFLMFTNGTLIDRAMAKKIAEVGNLTPAISVEGFEAETDKRRGKGVHQKIVAAMKYLQEEGVPVGVSITATDENAELVVSDKFINYYFNELGAVYGWIFQLMPIGRADCLNLMVSPEKRIKMFRKTQKLVREKGIFIADFWNSGCASSGCISAGREGGYLYIEWNGNITPCVFNPYSPVNINEVYKNNGTLNDVLQAPFFESIRKWQNDYALERKKSEMGNFLVPCAIKDHYDSMQLILKKHKPLPIDEAAKNALEDTAYQEGLKKYGEEVVRATEDIWKKEYLES